MTRTTPPRPLDVEALFPELSAYRGTTTRLHPRPGSPGVGDSSVGGPLLWPADEPWPVCVEPHKRRTGRRIEDVHRARRALAEAHERGITDEDRALLKELERPHRLDGPADTDPLPMLAVAQLYRRDLPDLAEGPDGCDLLQVFWCPFDAHGPTRYGMSVHLRWRRSAEVGEVLPQPPRPPVVGYDGYVAEPCVLHPERVVTYPFAGELPEELCERIYAWEEELEEAQDEAFEEPQGSYDSYEDYAAAMSEAKRPDPPGYQYDLSIPPGWRVGGYASWHSTDPSRMDCASCATPMRLLLTVDSTEWDGGSGSWRPVEEDGLPARRHASPTHVVVGNWGELNVFSCPADPAHPHRWSIQ
ncbi:hypothetical protein AB0M28_01315 [Streptomyces sp. NPDC051940]|uniref:hypothetical protein n=1 Tax=Streptomyces sp. NPDC051940 TaxID=3155675 RepID=UPI003434C7DE